MAKKTYKSDTIKKDMLEALNKSMGIVSTACEHAGISRQTHYTWLKDDEDYEDAVRHIESRTGDFVEGALLKKIKEGDMSGIIFYCKTKLKKRGYVERVETEHSGGVRQIVVSNQEDKEILESI